MSTAATVPIFAPDGTLGDIPASQLAAAVKAGAKPGVHVTGPDGSAGVIPADRTADAVKAGAKIVPIEDQPIQHPGFWADLGSDLGGMFKGSVQLAPKILQAVGGDAGLLQQAVVQQAEQMSQNWKNRTAAGEAIPYKVGAAANEALGVNVTGEEQAAKEGDVGGVLGHAAAVPAVMAATAGLSKVAPAAADIGASGIRTTAKAANAVAGELPGAAGAAIGGYIGHATGLPEGTLSGVIIGRELGKVAGKALPTMRIPGEGFGLPNRVVGGPANAPVYVPSPEPAAVFPGAPLPEAIGPEVGMAKGLAEGGKAVPEPAKALGELPVHAVQQAITELGPKAPIAEVTSRANTIARLSNLLNEGLGGRGLEPNVPLKDQGGVVTPKPVETIPEGHTPVESSAIKSYKYDPATREFETVTQSGSRYIHGDVSPEQAQAFEAAKSKGKAWNDLRQNSTLVAKVVNGKRIPIRPSLSDEDFISPDEWQAGHELDTGVEGTPRR